MKLRIDEYLHPNSQLQFLLIYLIVTQNRKTAQEPDISIRFLSCSLNTMSFIWSNESHCEIYFPHCYNTFSILRDNAVPLV